MMCVLEILVCMAGCWLMTRKFVRLGNGELRAPSTTFAGLILVLQLPIALGAGLAIGGAEGIKASRLGEDAGAAQARFAKNYWWLDLAVCGSAAALAGMVVLVGWKEIVYIPPPPDEAIGITDLRNKLNELDLPWEGPEAIPRDPNEPLSEMVIRESRRSSLRS